MPFGKNSKPIHGTRSTFLQTASWRVLLNMAIFALIACGANSRAQAQDLDAAALKRIKTQLQESGIEPTRDDVKNYLEELHPSPDSLKRMRQLIEDLGNDDFYTRESAMTELLRLPMRSPALYQNAIEAEDAEIRWRAKQVLKQGNQRTEQLLQTVFSFIRHEKVPGLFSLVLDAVPFCTEEYIREEALRTLKAIATLDDVPQLQQALALADAEVQQAALVTLEHLVGADADADLLPFLKMDNEALQLTAARALGNHGRREALPVLVGLLATEDLRIRAKTSETLRLLTGENFSFVAYDTAEKRKVASGKWTDWLANSGETAKLTFPIPDGPILRDHTLICNYSLKKVIELDANRKEIWSTELVGAWGCQGLPNGNRLVTSYSQRTIVEYDMSGKEIWKQQNLPGLPYSVERLPNGNTMVTCSNNQVIEYTPQGKMAWQKQFNGTPRDAQRLENGNTLVVLYSTQQLVEVDRQGKEVWKLENMQRPMCAQRLPNGNTLVCQSQGQRLVELDRKGTTVWSKALTVSIYDAQRLPNGNTLVVGSTGAMELDPHGKSVWQLNQPGMRGIHRF